MNDDGGASLSRLANGRARDKFGTVATFKFRNLKNGQAIPVPPGEFTIGRAADAYIHVEDSSISRQHARLLNSEQGFFLEDLGSANGIALNGELVTGRLPIKLGDMVHIGTVPFRVDPEVPGEASASPSAGLTRVDRGYIRKDTEKLNLTPKASPIVYVPGVDDIDAPSPTSSGALIRKSVPLPKLARLTATPGARPTTGALPRPEPARNTEVVAPLVAAPEAETVEHEDPSSSSWGWWIVIFLAGMAAGLLVGLYFAKMFLEMGGKPGALP